MQNVILLCNRRRSHPWFLKIICSTLLFCSMVFGANAQNTVRGRVIDETGMPMLGVNVVLKGTNTGTNTDFDGNYSLNVSGSSPTLVFSYLGYVTQEIAIGSQSVINISLNPDVSTLSEVVVIGYGTQRKESVTGSVVSITGEALTELPSANITQALQGRLAGVQINRTSSTPGASQQIRIRGVRSLRGSNDPLIVLDGIPFTGSLEDISPNDIKSIDVLKDASATAIYGARGANGVILITMNKGRLGQEPKITYNGFTGIQTLFAKYPMMNGPEFAALRAASVGNVGPTFVNTSDESNDVDTDWQDLLFETGLINSHDFGINGGTEKGSYNFGLGYYKEEGTVPLQDFERFSLRTSVDQKIGKSFRVGFNTNTNYSIRNNDPGVVGMAVSRTPITNPYNPDGSWKETVLESTSGPQWVPYAARLNGLGEGYESVNKAFATFNSFYGEVELPLDGLKYRANLGLNYRSTEFGNYRGEGVLSAVATNPSTASRGNTDSVVWLLENLLTYDQIFGKHKVNFTGLYSESQDTYKNYSISGVGLPADYFQYYNIGFADQITVSPNNFGEQQFGIVSLMGRVQYEYDNRYLLSATYRGDASSRLAKGNQWFYFPAVSAGWNISNEKFMENVKAVDFLKIKVGYGKTANQSVGVYSTLGRLSTRPYNFGDSTYSMGYYVTDLPNPNLGWEYSTTWNYALDFGLFNNRLSGTVEYYQQKTDNVLLFLGLPITSGVSGYTANVGKTENKGFEVSLNGVIIDNKDGWYWDASVNFNQNRNKLVALNSGRTRDEGNRWFVGSPINVIFDYKKVGLWQADDQYQNILEPGGNVGMIKVEYTGDFNPDGSPTRAISPDDRQIIDPQADLDGGFTSRLAYKNFDISIIGGFKAGGIVFSSLHAASGYQNNLNTRAGNNTRVDYWTPTNTGAKYPRPNGVGGDNPKYGETLGLFDASFVKIRTITLGYNFKQQFIKDAGIDNFRCYFTVTNPFVIYSPYHKETGLDPETNSFNNGLGMPTITTNSPTTRNLIFGINLTL